jgi:hypothetical protein
MISLILYGRNDNYGYNLHKRAAISLNCMAELLDDPDDEILFVDYNTPDDMPTFVEAILDTLTDRARRLIRVLRVRPSVHARWRGKTHLNALEPQARNIAVRRSSPTNRWILSTNTDMVFVMRDGSQSLSAAVKSLPRGYYGIPRYEMPESLWESLDRKDPQGIIGAFARWGRALHLDEVVHSHKSILYDAPGDFQLVPRADLIGIHGFNESMLLGWHVDSNLAKRFLLLYGETKSLFHKVAGYHCDHTKVVTPMHGHDRQQNDMVEHISDVRRPEMPQQAESWGAPDAAIEELRFPPGRDNGFAAALGPVLGPMAKPFYESLYTEKSWNQITYSARHVIPYLADQIATFPRDIDLAYAGMNDTLRALLAETWRAMGFTGRLLIHRETAGTKPGCEPPPESDAPYVVADLDHMVEHAALFILDFGVEDGPSWPVKIFHLKANPKAAALLPHMKGIQSAGMEIVAAERRRMADRLPPRRIVFVNTINAEFGGQAEAAVGQTITPFCTHVRHGLVKPDAVDVLDQRRADADRTAGWAARAVIASTEKPLPFELLDQAAPYRLLNDEQRAEIAAATATRDFGIVWRKAAMLSLALPMGNFDQCLAAYLAPSKDDPRGFLERLTLLRVVASEAMARPWPAESAAVIEKACAAFLDGTPEIAFEQRAQTISVMLALCSGASGRSLDGLAEAVIDHLAGRLRASRDPLDAWLALGAVESLQSRPKWAGDADRRTEWRQKIVAPSLRLLGTRAAIARSGDRTRRLAVIATAPFAHAVDPAAGHLADALELAASTTTQMELRIFPLQAPDTVFLAQAQQKRIEVAATPDLKGKSAGQVSVSINALALAIRAWAPEAVLAVGDSALVLGLLALGLATNQAIYCNRFADDGMPGTGHLIADRSALTGWLGAESAPSAPKGGAVGVAAR